MGLYTTYQVTVRAWLVDAQTGATLWEDRQSLSRKKSGLPLINNPFYAAASEVAQTLVKGLSEAKKGW